MTDLSLDDAWLSEPVRRSRLRWALVVLLAVAVVFYAGVQVQQRWGSAAAPSAAVGGPPAGMGGSGMPQLQQTANDGTTTPDVIGTVTAAAGRTWTVTDFGGTPHAITVPKGLKAAVGTTVSVSGDAVTIRTTTAQENP